VFVFTEICQRASDAALPFLLIGGHAVVVYGFPRQTRDVDLLVCETDRRRWDELITPLGYGQHQISRAFHMYNPVDRTLPPIDLMLVNEATFSKLSAEAKEVETLGARIRVPSLRHLIALKLHALSSGAEHRLAKDLLDVLELVRQNAVNLATPEYQEIVERYANSNVRAKLAEHLPGIGLGPSDAGSGAS
jgi:predicted nucleotidyltransferase